jgi:O-antigen/teichoic acid export membrane protein
MALSEAPILLLGLFYEPTYIGIYFIASQLTLVPVSFLTDSFRQVLFPAFSLSDKTDLPRKIQKYFKEIIYKLWLPILVLGVLLKRFGYLIVGCTEDIIIINSIITVLIIKMLFTLILNPLSTIPTVLKKPVKELYWSLGSISALCVVVYFTRTLEFIQMIYIFALIKTICLIIYIYIVTKLVGLQFSSFLMKVFIGLIINLPLFILLIVPQLESVASETIILILAIILSLVLSKKAIKMSS